MLDVLGPLRRAGQVRISGEPKVIVVGSGIGGLVMGYQLRRAGLRNFEILEKANEVGGTWRDNRYPGVACDIPSALYSLTFFPNPGWTQLNAPGPEIQEYLRALARKFGLYRHLRFGQEVIECKYRDGGWTLTTRAGETTKADFVVAAAGFLRVPRMPDVEGLNDFGGEVMHNACWREDVSIHGRRVGVIGTGSSGVQLVPAIAEQVAKLSVFQRTPQWMFPLENIHYTAFERFKRRLFPRLSRQLFDRYLQEFDAGLGKAVLGDAGMRQFFHDACAKNLERVKDPELRRRLTPDYPVLCKRMVFSARFYDAIQLPQCELVTGRIERIERGGIRTDDQRLHEMDVIVCSTGYQTHEYCRSMGIRGEGDLPLSDAWSGGVGSFEATSLARFPNFFMVGGPQSTVGNLSYTACAELQASYIVRAIQLRCELGARAIVATDEAQQRFLDDQRLAANSTVWKAGCQSWYLDEQGHIDIWAKSADSFIEMIDKGPQRADFRVIR